MNLLDQFFLQHVQVSLLEGRLLSAVKNAGTREARVELKLAPRPMKTDSGEELPAYQVSAKLSCEGGSKEDKEAPHFVANVGIEAIYQQTEGEPVDISEFSSHHASLTRQLYPLLQQELRLLLIRLGLEQLRLPFDLPAKAEFQEGDTVRFSGALH
jgi:hypothetical protein